MHAQSNQARVSHIETVERVLRLGILSEREPRLEEKLIPARAAVTVGKTPESTLAFPYAELPRPLTLFQPLSSGGYALCFSEEMSGTIKTKNREHTLQECIKEGLASKQGDLYSVTLPPSARGRVQLKGITLLFSFVPAKKRATPLLAKELQQPFFSSLDRPFLALLALSFVLHAGVAFIAQTRIVPQQEPLFLEETLASLIKQPIAAAPLVQEPNDVAITQDQTEAPPSPALTHTPRVTAAPSDEPKDGRVGLVAVLGRQSADGGPFADLFSGRDPSEVLDGVTPRTAAQAKEGDELGAPLKKGPTESGELLGLNGEDLKPDVPTAPPVTAPKTERPIKTKIEPITCFDCTGPGPGPEVGNPLGPYKQRIQLCYERELTNNDALQGKLSVQIDISEAGRVISTSITADTLESQSVSACVQGVIKNVKFPAQDTEVKASVSFIFSKN